jgi:hypothetical protein
MKFTTLSVILLLLCANPLYAFDKTGLVLYLRFDEGKGETARDASGKGNNGQLQGKVEWVDGKWGKAARISDDAANNMVVVKDDNTLDITGEMTIAMWVNIETIPDGNCSLITKSDTYMIHTSTWSGRGVEVELLLWPFDAWQTAASTPIQLNEWHHVIGVYDGEEIKMYIDGELKGRRTRAGNTAVTMNDLVIGRDSRDCCNTRRSAQIIDEVMMFNRAISEGETEDLMKANFISVAPGELLTAAWGRVKARF